MNGISIISKCNDIISNTRHIEDNDSTSSTSGMNTTYVRCSFFEDMIRIEDQNNFYSSGENTADEIGSPDTGTIDASKATAEKVKKNLPNSSKNDHDQSKPDYMSHPQETLDLLKADTFLLQRSSSKPKTHNPAKNVLERIKNRRQQKKLKKLIGSIDRFESDEEADSAEESTELRILAPICTNGAD